MEMTFLKMFPWLITIYILLLVIAGLIIERAISGYLNRKELREFRASQQRGFQHLASIQKELFRALRLSYVVAARMSKFAIDEMNLTNKNLGIPPTPAKEPDDTDIQSKLWPDIVGDKDER